MMRAFQIEVEPWVYPEEETPPPRLTLERDLDLVRGPARVPYLLQARVDIPSSWKSAVRWAKRLGLNVVAVKTETMGMVQTDSAGNALYLDGTTYLDESAPWNQGVLHEMGHFIVAKNRGFEGFENYGSSWESRGLDYSVYAKRDRSKESDQDLEVLACDVQIVWLMSRGKIAECVDAADSVNYADAPDGSRIIDTVASAQKEWFTFTGKKLRVTREQMQAVATLWGIDHPGDCWANRRVKA